MEEEAYRTFSWEVLVKILPTIPKHQ